MPSAARAAKAITGRRILEAVMTHFPLPNDVARMHLEDW
jgi:hypothetical protein